MRLAYAPYELIFKKPAGTSRGVLLKKKTYFLRYRDERNPGKAGYGEAALFEGLSPEEKLDYEGKLRELSADTAAGRETDISEYSSIIFGMEQARADLSNRGKGIYYPSPFTEGQTTIQINGLIWMGSKQEMIERIEAKIREGFRCIKIKIGAIDWDEELSLLQLVRELTDGKEIDLRVDANGAFTEEDCEQKLNDLSRFGLHSIEQPIKAGQRDFLRHLCRISPVPIALDEELIGIKDEKERDDLLDFVRPQYIVLKPALCFGFSGASSWIRLAERKRIGWWITSALESSVGLDAIAQFTGRMKLPMAQGLGTGNLYTNNLPSPLKLESDRLIMNSRTDIFHKELEKLEWIEM